MAAWMDVSHKDSEVWSLSWAAGSDLGGGASGWDVFWLSSNVHLGFEGNRKCVLGLGGAGFAWTWLWVWEVERLGFGFKRLGDLAGDTGDDEGDPLGRAIRRGL